MLDIMVKGGKMNEFVYTAKIKDSMNFVYPSKTEQKANFVYTMLYTIALRFNRRGDMNE